MTRWRGEPDPAHVRARRRVLGVGRGARAQRVDVHRARDRLDRRRRRGGALGGDRGDVRPAARRSAGPGAADDRRGRAARATRRAWSPGVLDRGERLMGFGHRVYRAEDPRARVLRRTCRSSAPRYEAAVALEHAALTVLRERRPDRAIETNVEFWAAVILDFAQVPPHMMPAMFTAPGRRAGRRTSWSRSRRTSWCARRRSTSARRRAARGGRRLGRDQHDQLGPAVR